MIRTRMLTGTWVTWQVQGRGGQNVSHPHALCLLAAAQVQSAPPIYKQVYQAGIAAAENYIVATYLVQPGSSGIWVWAGGVWAGGVWAGEVWVGRVWAGWVWAGGRGAGGRWTDPAVPGAASQQVQPAAGIRGCGREAASSGAWCYQQVCIHGCGWEAHLRDTNCESPHIRGRSRTYRSGYLHLTGGIHSCT